jgi:hypothetical protein
MTLGYLTPFCPSLVPSRRPGLNALVAALPVATFVAKSGENRIRRLARRHGYAVRKSREWKHVPHSDNFGDYMLIEPNCNFVVLGERFNATLEDIEAFFGSPKAA